MDFDEKVILILNIADILLYLLILWLVVLVHLIQYVIIFEILLPNLAHRRFFVFLVGESLNKVVPRRMCSFQGS